MKTSSWTWIVKYLSFDLSKIVVFMPNFNSVLEEILLFSSTFNSIEWSHVKKGGNHVDHHLAKTVPFRVEQVARINIFQRFIPIFSQTFCPLINALLDFFFKKK